MTGAGRIPVSFRLKIILAFLALSAVLGGVLSFSTYRILDRTLFGSLQARVANLSRIGSKFLDGAAVARLADVLDSGSDEAGLRAAERSTDYRAVAASLNAIRSTDPALVRYVYLFRASGRDGSALYLADADVPALRAEEAAGTLPEGQEISGFGTSFDLSSFPMARRALAEGIPLVEESYSYDPDFRVNSVTGYAPVFGRDGRTPLAVLGLDMVDTDVRAVLGGATRLLAVLIAAALALSVLTSVAMGTLFTRGILSLEGVVRRFGKENLGVRAAVRSRDEVGRLGDSFNSMAETIEEYSRRLEDLLAAYGRFVPHEFLRLLSKGSITDVRLGDFVHRTMAVLFSDIRSFTALSERMSPEENFKFLNSYLKRMGPEIRAHGGFIDKYIGDGIMALFPGGPDDALAAGTAMLRNLVEYNGHRAKSGYQPIGIGVGVNCGPLMLGTLGERERMDGSVIADTVNLCSRLEGLTRFYGASLLTTGPTLAALSAKGAFRHRFVGRVRVKGRREAVLVFEVFDGDGPDLARRKLARRAEFSRAVRLYLAARFAGAGAVFSRLAEESPDDAVALFYRDRCARLERAGTPEGWDGVEEIQEK